MTCRAAAWLLSGVEGLGCLYALTYALWTFNRFDRELESSPSLLRAGRDVLFGTLNLAGVGLFLLDKRGVTGWGVVFGMLALGALVLAWDGMRDILAEQGVPDGAAGRARQWGLFALNLAAIAPALWLNYRVAFG